MAKIYNIPSNLDGTGQTIAVVGQTNIDITDVQQYRSIFGLPANDPTIILNGPDPGIIDDESEADLDVEVSGGVAPKAALKFVISRRRRTPARPRAPICPRLYIVDNNLAGVMSESYGACEPQLGAMAMPFITPCGSRLPRRESPCWCPPETTAPRIATIPIPRISATAGLAVSGIASTPFNVSVGGTDFMYTVASPSSVYWNTTNSGTPATESAKSYIPETT